MSTKILHKRKLIPGQTSELTLYAPHIAVTAKPGHFIMLRVSEQGERIPLTIANTDAEKGTISIVYLVIGKSTALLETLEEGDSILDVCGPLGQATHLENYYHPVICAGGGTGIAAMHHIAKGHHRQGNYVIACIAARNESLLLFEEELSAFCDEVHVATDDGSKGVKGLITDPIKDILSSGKTISEVVAVGPVPMMRAVAELTRPYKVKTVVSLNSLMVDGIGMCGACRVTVGGKTRFTCTDGPEFDGHEVDFDELSRRLCTFKPQEEKSYNSHRCSCHDK